MRRERSEFDRLYERRRLPNETNGHKQQKRGHGINRNPLIFMVGGTGFEPVTSTV